MNPIDRILPGIAAYPDIHPMIVHFPVALFPVAFFFACLAVWRYPLMIRTSRWLVLLGTAAAGVAVATGLIAEDAIAHGAGTIVDVHKGFMLVTLALAVILSIFVIAQWRNEDSNARRIHLVALLVLNIVLTMGADRGALVALRLRTGADLHLPHVAARAGVAPEAFSADSTRGRELYATFRCADCHGSDRKMEAAGIPPTLLDSGSKLQTAWIRSYLLHPHRIRWIDEEIRPLMRMPDFELEEMEAENIAAYLASRTESAHFPAAPVEQPPLTPAEAEQGRILFAQYSCKGCHELDGTGNEVGPALDGAGTRLQAPWIYAFIRDPKGIIPGTAMKDFHLGPQEARAITAYLMTLRAAPDSSGAAREQ